MINRSLNLSLENWWAKKGALATTDKMPLTKSYESAYSHHRYLAILFWAKLHCILSSTNILKRFLLTFLIDVVNIHSKSKSADRTFPRH